MSDRAFEELKCWLERAVAAVPAGRARQAAMREELQAHLTAIYEEELARWHDESAATESAKRRFGDLEILGGELQATIPRWERIKFFLRKGNIMWRWLLFLGFVAVLVGLGFVFPAVAKFTNPDLAARAESAGLSVALLIMGVAVTLGGLACCVWGAMIKLRPRSS